MIIRGVAFRAETPEGPFGFFFEFSRNLTVIRAGNSSGKSTLINTLLYGLGMEEIAGGTGTKALVSAVQDSIEYEDRLIPILRSEVLAEVENAKGEVVTFRRAIRDEELNTKLVRVYHGSHLIGGEPFGEPMPTFVHDDGGGRLEQGFHFFFEKFLGLELPRVATTTSGETKLYLQTLFAAHIIEQKRGWTDYIANVPYFRIRDAKTRVAEFLLGLEVFELNSIRNKLDAEAVAIDEAWRSVLADFKREARSFTLEVQGIPAVPTPVFHAADVQLHRAGNANLSFDEHMKHLRAEHVELTRRAEGYGGTLGKDAMEEIDRVTEQVQRLSVLHERAGTSLALQRASLLEYENLLCEAERDLERNRVARKLKEFGHKHSLEVAGGQCPTCHQDVADDLLDDGVGAPRMDIQANIDYLESQTRMLKRQIAGLKDDVRRSEATVQDFSVRIAAMHDHLSALRGDVSSGAAQSKAVVRRQVQVELEIGGLDRVQQLLAETQRKLLELADRVAANRAARSQLPKETYSENDGRRISAFEFQFRANAGSFGYKSAKITDIQISRENLVPSLAKLELREIFSKEKGPVVRTVEGKALAAESSASDFVRLIWSYLLALYQASASPSMPGHHLGLLVFDEPGQHAMRVESQHALLQLFSGERGLQSIVAASFDEAETVFREATEGVQYELISWEGKLIRPLRT